MCVVKTSKLFQETKEYTAEVIILCLTVLYTSPSDFSLSLPCNSPQGHAVPCTVAGKQKVLKNVVSKVVYTGFQRIKVSPSEHYQCFQSNTMASVTVRLKNGVFMIEENVPLPST